MLSVATVVLNDPAGLKKTIDSVRIQKRKGAKIEFIIADGGSDEPTLNLIEQERDTIDLFLVGPDNGIYHGMNRLLDAANGDSILFLNSGDAFYRELDLVSMMESYALGERNHYGKVIQQYQNDCYERPKSCPKRLDTRDISHQAFFVPRKVYKSTSFNLSYALSSDKVWINECIGNGGAVYIDQVISVFVLGGISNAPSFKSLTTKLKENTSVRKKVLQVVKISLKLFCSQRIYYRIIYFFKYRHTRCTDI